MMMEFRHKENTLNIKKKTKTKGERYWKGKKHFKSVNNFLTILMSNLKEKEKIKSRYQNYACSRKSKVSNQSKSNEKWFVQ